MITNSEKVISDVTKYLINNVEKEIEAIMKAQENKSSYCSRKIFNLLGQISDQITYVPKESDNLKTPHQNKNLRLDSHMSVFNVQVRQQAPRGRSLTKINRIRKLTSICQPDKKIGKRRITIISKIIPLNGEKSNTQYNDQIDDEQIKLDQLRTQIKKRKQKQEKLRCKSVEPKYLSARQLKQKFSYDYDFGRLKVKSQIKNNLILPSKNLLAQLSKKVEKKDLPHKIRKPEISSTEVKKVVQKKKKIPVMRKKKSIIIQDFVPIEQTFVQFSTIKTLSDKLTCEAGVNFSFEGHLMSNRSKSSNKSNQTKKYSKLEFQIMKKRSKTSMSQFTSILNKKLTNQKNDNQSIQLQLNICSRDSDYYMKKQRRHQTSKIYVENETLKYYLQTDGQEKSKGQVQCDSHLIQSQKSRITLDRTDEYNINYIKGIAEPRKKKYNQLQHTLPPITPKQPIAKIPYLKARQKLENRNSIINEMKKKFEQTLRDRQSKINE